MAQLASLGGNKFVSGNRMVKEFSWPPRDEQTAELLKEVYMSGKWSFNSEAEQAFENDFAQYHGAKYGIFMVNGTTTLECALTALGCGKGDEVIVPALTWMATAIAASYVGAIPVFVDVEPTTLCMDPAKLEAAITPRTKAIIPVHVYGSMADLDKILQIADAHNIPVIEDCAHMHGGFWNGRGVGSWGKIGSFSFQQSKTMSSGEGGICITNDPELADKLYRLKHIGYSRGLAQGQAQKAPEGLLCHNYRGTAFQAVILHQQLKALPGLIKTYSENMNYLTEKIKDIPGVRVQSPGRLASPQAYYSFHLIFDGGEFNDIPRWLISKICYDEGVNIGNGTHGAVYKHNLFNLNREKGEYRIAGGDSCPVCETVCGRTLGWFHQTLMYRENMDIISDVLHKVAENMDEVRELAKDWK
ncbi:MAG: DegT/DnrJ/EryC1/StrS family aminotransferase [Lentisphaeria bacterium]|nr:DegT/DnrJ/EryC1/StrS family aminotransferase [Lentisphaeria bacterium]